MTREEAFAGIGEILDKVAAEGYETDKGSSDKALSGMFERKFRGEKVDRVTPSEGLSSYLKNIVDPYGFDPYEFWRR